MPLSNLMKTKLLGKFSSSSTSPASCERCVQLAKKLFSIVKSRHYPSWVIDFDSNSYSELCPFCRMLRSVLTEGDQHRSHTRFALSLEDRKSSRTHFYMSYAGSFTNPVRDIISGTESEGRIVRAESNIDVSLVKEWIRTCDEEHQSCRKKARKAVPGLRVIDCKLREVLLAPPDTKYITLSYVWGKDSTAPMFSTRLPHLGSLPPTIEDSLHVTIQLGYRYLWIDRYCINQQDLTDTLRQREQMDSIYANSDMTIIAAAGDSPDRGLPGVGGSMRNSCARVVVGSKKTTLATVEPWDLVKESVWNTRGWTYQEEYLSFRRLFFTDAQVFFECQTKAVAESEWPIWREHSPLSLARTNADYYFVADLTKVLPWSIMECIRKYGSRHLTQQSDILRAFLGIFNDFSKAIPSIQHCCGVPIWDPALVFKDSRPEAAHLTLPQAFCIGLAFETKIPHRRHGFPSWSWTGRQSEISWHYLSLGEAIEVRAVQEIFVGIEMEKGEVIDLAAFQNLCVIRPAIQHQLPLSMHITSWYIPLIICKVTEQLTYLQPHQQIAYANRITLEHTYQGWASERFGFNICFQLRLREEIHVEGGSFVGIYVGSMESSSVSLVHGGPILLIRQKAEGHVYERVGSTHIDDFDRFDAAGDRIIPTFEEEHLSRYLLPDLQSVWRSFRLR